MPKGTRTDIDQSNEGILQRIKSKCVVNDNGCWMWNAGTNNKGRPVCSVRAKIGLAYRHAYQAYHDKILSSEIYLCHKCDNQLCCNPEHLFEGDNQSNQLDYVAKHGEIKNGNNSGPKYVNTGLERSSTVCPSNVSEADRLEWYKNNACDIVDTCWLWSKEIGADGYGRVKYKGQKHMSHRIMWMLANNKNTSDLEQLKQNGLVIRHICPADKPNKACCNPEHLTTGSRSENAIDSANYSLSYKYHEDIIEWLYLYEIYLNERNRIAHKAVAQGLIALGLVSHGVSERYVVDVLRGKLHKHIHKEFFEWTPEW
jgi:hypothetical protein